jgi:hypothetical protein
MSERITWEDCPSCARAAAVGWLDGEAVEFDCPSLCWVTLSEIRAIFRRRRGMVAEPRGLVAGPGDLEGTT